MFYNIKKKISYRKICKVKNFSLPLHRQKLKSGTKM